MLKRLINEFRTKNGKQPLEMGHFMEDQHCLWHCFHMSRIRECCHAPEEYRRGKSEAVAMRSFFHNPQDTLYAIVFEQFANSPEHRSILLDSNNLACASVCSEYNMFVTVRGW